MKFTASRLSAGNKIFPAEITLEETGFEVKIPGLFSGDSKFISYDSISAVEINTPMIGYSTLTFFHSGNKVTAHGFTKEDTELIKEEIEKRRAARK